MEIIFVVIAIFIIGLIASVVSNGKDPKSGRRNSGGGYPMDSHHHDDCGDHHKHDIGGWDGGGDSGGGDGGGDGGGGGGGGGGDGGGD